MWTTDHRFSLNLKPILIAWLVIYTCVDMCEANDDKDALPVMNICVFDDAPTEGFIQCLVDNIDKELVERNLSAIRELFPDTPLLDTLRYVCKANNDEGHVIIDAIADNLTDEEMEKALPTVWECHDKYLL